MLIMFNPVRTVFYSKLPAVCLLGSVLSVGGSAGGARGAGACGRRHSERLMCSSFECAGPERPPASIWKRVCVSVSVTRSGAGECLCRHFVQRRKAIFINALVWRGCGVRVVSPALLAAVTFLFRCDFPECVRAKRDGFTLSGICRERRQENPFKVTGNV